jgi:hypothetical protein
MRKTNWVHNTFLVEVACILWIEIAYVQAHLHETLNSLTLPLYIYIYINLKALDTSNEREMI